MFLSRLGIRSNLRSIACKKNVLRTNTLRSSTIFGLRHITNSINSIKDTNETNKEVKIDNKDPDKKKGTPTRPGYFKPPIDPGLSGRFQEDYEKIAKYTLIPLTLIPFYTVSQGIPLNPMVDATLSIFFLMYTHYGFSSLIYQKVPKEKYPRWHDTSLWTLYTSSFVALCGIYEIETENNGLVDLITKIWNYDERNLYVFGR